MVGESCEKGYRHGLKFSSVHTRKSSPGGGWVAAGWLRSPGMGLGSGMVILSWPLDRFLPFRPNANTSSHSSCSSSTTASAISVVIACAAGVGFWLGYLLGWLAWPSCCC